MIHTATSLAEFKENGSWDGLILVTDDQLSGVGKALSQSISSYRELDQSAHTGVHLIPCPEVMGSRLILCCIGSLDREGDDIRLVSDGAAQGMKRALAAGLQRPCLQVCLPHQGDETLETALFSALAALWVPLEAREVTRGRSLEAVGVVCDQRPDLSSEPEIAQWRKWVSAVEIGRSVARDVAGTEPERMSPLKIAELCKRAFKGTEVKVEIVKDRHILEAEYPLLSAVARASWTVERHQPRVIRLSYEGGGEKMIALAGKGVTYDTGGADLKTGGHMAGMSRDKGGAAAVIGFMLSVAHLRPKGINFIAEIGAVRNSIGADSFVTDEIITSHAGVRVRIGNTDAEGRLVLADVLSHLRERVQDRRYSHLMSVATLTGHAYKAVGPFTIAVDNDAARSDSTRIEERTGFNAAKLQESAEKYGEGVELSRLRTEDFKMIRARSLAEDIISCNNEPSSATPRGHQFPAAFLIKAAGLSNDGLQVHERDQQSYRFTHIDIGGSGVEGGDWQHGRPTAAPVLGLVSALIPWEFFRTLTLLIFLLGGTFAPRIVLAQSVTLEVTQDKGGDEAHGSPLHILQRSAPLLVNEAMGVGGMVVADNELASEIGAQVLREGGDAADAAVATALALGVLQPFASGIGGGGFAVISRGEVSYALDFREVAPLAATADMYLDQEGNPIKGLSTVGALAAGVPGEVAGLAELHKRHGKLPWHRLVDPALKLASDGFEMHALLYKRVKSSISRVKLSPTLSESLLNEGEPKSLGSIIKFPALARTLKQIALQGANGFYRGEVATELERSVKAAGGIITAKDLNDYKVKERAVISGDYRGYTLLSMPPPSSGGLVIIQALRALEAILGSRDPSVLGRESGVYLHALTETLKHGFADRANYMGDPDYTPIPVDKLLNEKRIMEIKSKFNANHTLARSMYGENRQPTSDGGTSHFNVIDAAGNAIALTTTINTGFGSRFVAGGTGVLLNNEMDDFIVKPGVPNAYGLIGRASNAVQAGKRPLSSMSPTIILKGKLVVGMVGGSGGPTIITGTLQTLLNLIHFDGVTGEVGRAVSAPRIHHQWVPETLMYDEGYDQRTLDALLARGHVLRQWPQRFTSIQALWVSSINTDGEQIIVGAADPSKLGRPVAVNKVQIKKFERRESQKSVE